MKLLYILIFVNCLFTACKGQTLKVAEFEMAIKSDTVNVLDVRTANEFNTGHLAKALHADWLNKPEFERRTAFISKEKPLYVYCLSGARSAAAATFLRNKGYKKVIELNGGITAWNNAAKPTEGSNSDAKQMAQIDFDNAINAKLVLVDVGATWCPPCVQMKPIINKLVKAYAASFTLLNVDGGIDKTIVANLKVEKLPVFIVYKNGIQLWRKDGVATEKELKTALGLK